MTKARLLLHVEKARRPVGSSAMTLLVRYFIFRMSERVFCQGSSQLAFFLFSDVAWHRENPNLLVRSFKTVVWGSTISSLHFLISLDLVEFGICFKLQRICQSVASSKHLNPAVSSRACVVQKSKGASFEKLLKEVVQKKTIECTGKLFFSYVFS